ncbi:MAG: RNase H family protein [Pelagibacteraceae bacterium]
MQLHEITSSLNIEWKWVKAHAGDLLNEEVDFLAKKAAQSN